VGHILTAFKPTFYLCSTGPLEVVLVHMPHLLYTACVPMTLVLAAVKSLHLFTLTQRRPSRPIYGLRGWWSSM